MAPKDIDTTVAHPARVYDYWLGGKDHFAADREAAEEVLRARPAIRLNVRANRAFLARSVRYLACEAGVRQFLDVGTGIPSANNTHEVAQSVDPDARVVYVDNDRCNSGCVHKWSVTCAPEIWIHPTGTELRKRMQGVLTMSDDLGSMGATLRPYFGS